MKVSNFNNLKKKKRIYIVKLIDKHSKLAKLYFLTE